VGEAKRRRAAEEIARAARRERALFAAAGPPRVEPPTVHVRSPLAERPVYCEICGRHRMVTVDLRCWEPGLGGTRFVPCPPCDWRVDQEAREHEDARRPRAATWTGPRRSRVPAMLVALASLGGRR
jgi:hypothetical protein